MAVGELESKDCCANHEGVEVVLFCQNCEILICPKCVSQTPNAPGMHSQHVYLDLNDAYNFEKDDIEKILANFKDQLHRAKQRRWDAQGKLQKAKLEILGKRTQLDKQTRSLRDKLKILETGILRRVEQVAAPGIQKMEHQFSELDYEVVAGEGLLCSAESLYKLQEDDSRLFLKNIIRLKREILNKVKILKEKRNDVDKSEVFRLLQKVSLNLCHEKRSLSKAFGYAVNVPATPKFLPSWCVIGQNRACLTWKYSISDLVNSFSVYIRQTENKSPFLMFLSRQRIIPQSDQTTYKRIILHRFTPGRTQVIIHDLRPATTYIVKLCARNPAGNSPPAVTYFKTSNDCCHNNKQSMLGKMWFRGHAFKRSWSLSLILLTLLRKMTLLLAYLCLIFVVLYVLFALYEDIMCERLLRTYKSPEFYDVCPFPEDEIIHNVPHQETISEGKKEETLLDLAWKFL